MKVTIEVDCTPEEARRMMGLPDLTSLHDLYVERMREALDGKVSPELVSALMRTWSPEAGMDFWRQMFASGGMTKTGG